MSLLRELIADEEFERDAHAALVNAALLVRRAGLEHLVSDATLVEVEAMALAGERLADERLASLVNALEKPEDAIAAIDGGRSQARSLLKQLLTKTRSDNGPS